MEELTNESFALQVIRDSWLGFISRTTEQLSPQQFVIIRHLGSGVGDGLLYINGTLVNIPPSAVMDTNELQSKIRELSNTFPQTLEEFRTKFSGAKIMAFFNVNI